MERLVLASTGPSRLAAATGILRRACAEEPTDLVLDQGSGRRPVIILPSHTIGVGAALLGDEAGVPLVSDGDQVTLVGGGTPDGDPRGSAMLVSRVYLLSE